MPYAPVSHEKDLGWAYNNFMKKLADDDWACFLDHDAMFTTATWYQDIEKVIENTDYGLIYCMTNRINPTVQKFKNINQNNHDIKYHRTIGRRVQEHYGTKIIDYDMSQYLPSGVCIIISKQAWKTSGGFKSGFLSVDNDIALKCTKSNIKVGLMKGLYVYHWYRGDGNVSHVM